MSGRLGTLAIHADGDVTLEDDSLGTGIAGCLKELQMQMVLDVVDDRRPLRKRSVPLDRAEAGGLRFGDKPVSVWDQPVLIVIKPLAELLG